MGKSIRHYLIAICTLLSLLGQGVLANGHTMIAPNHSQMNDKATASVMLAGDQNNNDCHGMMQAKTASADDTNHCCDNGSNCANDCSHCFTITFTGTVLTTDISVSPAPADEVIPRPTSLLFSIDGTPAFRPPIV
ncbi:hypothetical protein K8B83_00535 [Shewanella inventionis]|uniref:hypothetical protein n=1 Tax=Shewanella inventionis TaxID=1738770 RepID=UPI001CBD78E5|nr:hypothetical protein [Shewanella inventionis]UAL43417.1 hypothetical protein K8B83_00535 [Shewanella inventionis]